MDRRKIDWYKAEKEERKYITQNFFKSHYVYSKYKKRSYQSGGKKAFKTVEIQALYKSSILPR